jgi:hypothetical protein
MLAGMAKGVLIGESFRVGAELTGVELRVTKVARVETTSATATQPRVWTVMDFEAVDGDGLRLAAALAACLAPHGGWYANFNTAAEAFVIFADKVFRYSRGDKEGRAAAMTYARSVGVPEPQLDWDDD